MRGRIETRRGEVRGKRDMSVMGASSSSLPADAIDRFRQLDRHPASVV